MRNDPIFGTRFHNPAHEVNGFQKEYCINAPERHLLRFLVPIVNPEKPAFITNQLLKTIMESYEGRRVIGWGHIVEDLVAKVAKKVNNKKGCPLAPFLYHLYAQYDCLNPRETTLLRLTMEKRRDSFPGEPILSVGFPAPARLLLAAPALGPCVLPPPPPPR